MAYINRENLIQLLAHENSNIEAGRQYYGAIYQKVMNIPTADVVEVKHGEWYIGEFNKTRLIVVAECSECNCVLERPMSTFGSSYNYCPSCGAKMDGKRSDT